VVRTRAGELKKPVLGQAFLLLDEAVPKLQFLEQLPLKTAVL
jgi:hypothetical protein